MEVQDLDNGSNEREALDFTRALAKLSPVLEPIVKKSERFWFPDQPRALLLLGDLGAAFAGSFNEISPEARAAILAEVEKEAAREGEDDYLGTAVCTGFLEGLIHRAEREGTWPTIEEKLGSASRAYADAYRSASFHVPPDETLAPQGQHLTGIGVDDRTIEPAKTSEGGLSSARLRGHAPSKIHRHFKSITPPPQRKCSDRLLSDDICLANQDGAGPDPTSLDSAFDLNSGGKRRCCQVSTRTFRFRTKVESSDV